LRDWPLPDIGYQKKVTQAPAPTGALENDPEIQYFQLSKTDLKAQLIKEGRWDDYLDLRAKYTEQGMTPKSAKREAITELLIRPLSQSVLTPPPIEPVVIMEGNVPVHIPDPPEVVEIMEPEEVSKLVDHHIWDKKPEISMRDETLWAVRNMRAKGLEPKDSPSLFAWSLLDDLRMDEDFAQKMINQVTSKAMTRKDDGDGNDDEDETQDRDLLGQIKEVAEMALEAKRNPYEGE